MPYRRIRYARTSRNHVGSTNLNPASWLGNWEPDVVVEDERFGQAMEQMFLDDLARSTEIVLTERRRVRPTPGSERSRRPVTSGSGSAGRAAAGAIRLGSTVGAAIGEPTGARPRRGVDHAAYRLAAGRLAFVAYVWPRVVALPLAVISARCAVALGIKAFRLCSGVGGDRSRSPTP